MSNKDVIHLIDSDSDSSDECSHIKQRKLNVNVKDTFKENVLSILQKVETVEPGEFAVCGKIDAPMTTVSIRVII